MAAVTQDTVTTKIPARMDRLPWSRWHWYIIASLGTVWILDGLEVTMKGSVGPAIKEDLGLSSGQIGQVASIYVAGAILGALFWGYLTDRTGRKKLFLVTLAVYMTGVVLTTVSWGFWSFGLFRFITGFGIGGEYAAVNSAVDELIPARARGWADLAINGSYWFGGAIAAGLALLYLNLLPIGYGWRAGFATGAVLAVGILLLRRSVPESPRWLMTHGQEDEAERIVDDIEHRVADDEHEDVSDLGDPPDSAAIELRERRSIGFVELARTMFRIYPRRSTVSLALMGTQAFLYNAIFFTYGLILTTFFDVGTASVGIFMVPFAIGNLLGPLLLGRLFDTVGRRPMISGCYIGAGALTIALGYAFASGWLSAVTMTIGWTVIFFFASAGASAGYLTVSETFPLEIRAMAIAFFYAIATARRRHRRTMALRRPHRRRREPGHGVHRLPDRRRPHDPRRPGGAAVGRRRRAAGPGGHRQAPLRRRRRGRRRGAGPDRTSPLGLDPADADSVRRFQDGHDLRDDGVIGASTQGAMRAERQAADELDDGDALLLDPADADDVARFQRRFGLVPDGVVGPQTRGALRLARRVVDLDPADAEEVRAVQREAGLADDGVLGPETQVALRALQAERATDAGLEGRVDPAVDPGDAEDITRFQQSVGLDDDAVIGPVTRGALAAARAHRQRQGGVDITDADAVRRLQSALGVEADGVVGPRTQAALASTRPEAGVAPDEAAPSPVVDPLDVEQVRAFQSHHGLEPSGDVDEETRQAVRYEADHFLGVDPSSAASVEDFQRRVGLDPDGVVGPATQGALRARRADLEASEDEERRRRYGRFADPSFDEDGAGIDPADASSIRRFQSRHGLTTDGVIGPRTQVALRAVGAGALHARPGPERHVHAYRRRYMGSGLMSATTVPSVDTALEGEVDAIVDALADGPRSTDELAEALRVRRWGPGRFRHALAVAEEEGRLRRTGRHEVALADDALVGS